MKQITKQYKLLYFLLILLSLTSALLMTFFSLQLGRILDSISNSNSGLLFHITICVSSILLWFLISCSYSYLKNQYVKKVILDLKGVSYYIIYRVNLTKLTTVTIQIS